MSLQFTNVMLAAWPGGADLARHHSVPPMGQYGIVGPVPVYQSASCPSVTADLVSGQCVECCQESITRLVLARLGRAVRVITSSPRTGTSPWFL